MNDVLAPEIYSWRMAENIIRENFEKFGFSEIKTPIVENTTLFSRNLGETSDIVRKEMYTFLDRNEESLTLRPEGTAPVVRALVEHNLLNTDPVQRLYYWGPMFRYERPQKGRYRQFFQYGVEVFGVAAPQMDAELIAMLMNLYGKFQLKNLKVKLGSMGCDQCRLKYREALVSLLKPSLSDLCEDCKERAEKNPLRVFDCKNPTCKEIAKGLPSLLDFLDEGCKKHFESVGKGLAELQTPFIVDRTLVRGFDYYNRTVFEITTEELGAQNAVGGGGRYDNLVKELGGPDCPAIGYAGGVERLILLLGQREEWKPKLALFIVVPDERGMERAFQLAFNLREKGLTTEIDYTGKSMKSQMKKADKFQAEHVLILGGSEIDQNTAILRNMSTKEQQNLKLENIESELLGRLK